MRHGGGRFFGADVGHGSSPSVEDAIADIAFLFNWPLDQLERMELGELLSWRRLAVERHNAINAPPERKG
ncbi:GpE family phage tail protein [Comamonas sp. MYb21]|uniref:GpE family phage tail protein n=1 Tax=Comamonas sp. MYb21 TaxID=1848648 RepID=UPI0030AA006F